MKTINDYDFKGKKALVRVDFNVPLDSLSRITDDTRVRAAIPTIQKVLSGGGAVILMSHLGRPKKGPEEASSLKHVRGRVEELLGLPVKFAADCIGVPAREAAAALQPGEVLLLENLRFHPEEEKGDEAFARELASLGDLWINDAFGTAHRAHASTAIIARFFPDDKLFGLLMMNEIASVDKVMLHPERPFTAIMGGSKVSSKINIIMNLLDKVDNLILGGGMVYTFMKARGGQVGASVCENDKLPLALDIMEAAGKKGVNLVLSHQTVASDGFNNEANTRIVDPMQIPDGWMGMDIGPATRDTFARVIEASRTILWNGPVGVFEFPRFAAGTRAVAESIARATANGAFSLIGGGDSVAAINQFGLEKQVSYVSTGGGALLEYIEGIELPGIAAIRG
ncbi:MAG: phosphoglycerate kinase [Odoribacteraceae bacterium]|jgi:phosphoglycerate kinase|nr:phosphoglycerate kinase [Odoribacteraceae bacterium]